MPPIIPLNIIIIDPEPNSRKRLFEAMKPHREPGKQQLIGRIIEETSLDNVYSILENCNIDCIFCDVISLGLHEASEFIFNIRENVPSIIFVLYNDSEKALGLGAEFYSGKRARFRHYFLLNKRSTGEKLARKLLHALHLCMSDLRLKASINQRSMVLKARQNIPIEISHSLTQFRAKYENTLTAFIMMSFERTELHDQVAEVIRDTIKPFNIQALRADDFQFHDNLYDNIRTYMHGCDFGVSVIEAISNHSYNPNIVFETGYMKALGKPVCLLKDKSIKTLNTDLLGQLYRRLDTHDIQKSVREGLQKWIGDQLCKLTMQ